MSNILIVYYSRKGQNYWAGEIKNLSKGNTAAAAEFIQQAIGGDMFEIDTVKPYSEDYTECINQAKSELRAKARPEIQKFIDSIDRYDTIFVGYPNWWGTMPMCMLTFLEHYDFAGKKIVPFCTNEGSGMGNSERDLKKVCRGSDVKPGLSITGNRVYQMESRIKAWASENK
ncbi:MAG: NAD(P)H-dependent oxidoreductase [Spirochaetia bacterium]|nr:NAD(P)H-dependent oxidoreductase [Spirochaetia bacterium]